jgi:hypothetical protein
MRAAALLVALAACAASPPALRPVGEIARVFDAARDRPRLLVVLSTT